MNRILLIEDDASSQTLYRNRLADLGYQVVASSTGAMGLMEARSALFDLFLVDIDLGSGIDGYEVCRRLKTIPEIHGVPVVLISGHVKTQEDLHRGYEAGCQSFLVKGDLMLLEDVVRAMLHIKLLQNNLAQQNRLLEDRNRRLEAEKARSADLEHALSSGVARQSDHLYRPTGMLLVDGEGVVRASDRGARDVLGQEVEKRHLSLLAPDSRLEAFVRNARTEPHELVRFELPERTGRSSRTLYASVYPFVPQPDQSLSSLRLVMLFDGPIPQRQGAARSSGASSQESPELLEAAREVFRPSALRGHSAAMRELRARVARSSQAETPALIQGPSGSGKSFLAHILHFSGPRSGAIVSVTCPSVSSPGFEAELLGTAQDPESGERTGDGAFQAAAGGTLYLQDIERLSPSLQQRLIEVLVQGQVRRQGATTSESVDVRILAGTRGDLARAVAQGLFSPELEALFAETIVLPALKKREGDIPDLALHFLARHERFEESTFAADALGALKWHDWPDNVRELEQTVKSACETAKSAEIRLSDLPAPLPELCEGLEFERASAHSARTCDLAGLELKLEAVAASLDSTVSLLDAYERGALLHALSLTHGDKLAAAKILRIGKSTFYRKLKLHGIT